MGRDTCATKPTRDYFKGFDESVVGGSSSGSVTQSGWDLDHNYMGIVKGVSGTKGLSQLPKRANAGDWAVAAATAAPTGATTTGTTSGATTGAATTGTTSGASSEESGNAIKASSEESDDDHDDDHGEDGDTTDASRATADDAQTTAQASVLTTLLITIASLGLW